jgi:hypothetical protein
MSFAIRNLHVLAYANGFTLWNYKAAPGELDAIQQPNFFTAAGDMLAVGDQILVFGPDGGATIAVLKRGDGYYTKPMLVATGDAPALMMAAK